MIVQEKKVQKKLDFVYKLKYEESYETFLVLNMKYSKKVRGILTVVMTVIAAVMLILHWLDNRSVHYYVIAIIDILLLFYSIYAPVLKAKKGAKTVTRKNGTYKIGLTEKSVIHSQGITTQLKSDKDARAVETENVFVLRPDRMHTFCLPKRILTSDEIKKVRQILKTNMKYMKM